MELCLIACNENGPNEGPPLGVLLLKATQPSHFGHGGLEKS